MKKINLLFLIVFFSFFMGVTGVEAKNYLTCKYRYTDTFDRQYEFSIELDDNGVVLNTSNCSNCESDSFGVSNPTYDNIYNDEKNELFCPIIYVFTYQEQGLELVNKIYFSIDNSEYHDSYGNWLQSEADIKANYTYIDNSYNGENYNEENDILKTCIYYDKNISVSFSFGIRKDYKLTNLSDGFIFADADKKLYSCPNYLWVYGDDNSIYFEDDGGVPSGATQYFIEGSTIETSKNTIAKYLLYQKADSKNSIYVTYDGNSVSFALGGYSGKINISNSNEFESAFRDGNVDNYPTYILVSGSGNKAVYQFANKSNSNVSKVYMLKDHILNVAGVGQSALEKTCGSIIGDNFLTFLNDNVFRIIYIAIPIILIVLTTLDFAKVVFVDDKEGIQAAFKKFGKRAIVAVLIYLVPNILIFAVNLIGADEVEQCAQALKNIAESEKSKVNLS